MSKLKLNQVIAISNGEKARKISEFSKAYHLFKRRDVFEGLTKRYNPFKEDPTGANNLPDEDKVVQTTVTALIELAKEVLSSTFNIVATCDIGNTIAKADVVIDGKVIAREVPATHLLFLEKQMKDIITFIESMPTLDLDESWEFDGNTGLYRGKEKVTIRTQKERKTHILSEATDKHPAQVEVYNDDVPHGTWKTIKYSGAIKPTEKEAYLLKARRMLDAVRMAREEANMTEVAKSTVGTSIISYIFDKQ